MDKNLDTIQNIEINNELKNFSALKGNKRINRVYTSFSNYHVAQSKISNSRNAIELERANFEMDKAFVIANKEFQALSLVEKLSFMDLVFEKIQACINSKSGVVKLTGIMIFQTIISKLESVQEENIQYRLDIIKRDYEKLKNGYLGIENEERDFGTN